MLVHADRVTTRFGDKILLSIRDSTADTLYKVFLPQRYGTAFKDEVLQAINEGTVHYWLVSKGECPKTKAYTLAIEWNLLFLYSVFVLVIG